MRCLRTGCKDAADPSVRERIVTGTHAAELEGGSEPGDRRSKHTAELVRVVCIISKNTTKYAAAAVVFGSVGARTLTEGAGLNRDASFTVYTARLAMGCGKPRRHFKQL